MYTNPFSKRYGTDYMRDAFSDETKYMIWRKLWIELARAQRAAGVNITVEQIREMQEAQFDVDMRKVAEYEDTTHHEVMAHIMEFSDRCPHAKDIIHLGATSCYITDNADILMMRLALDTIIKRLDYTICNLNKKAFDNADVNVVGRTHLQAAQPTTVGKRMCMWVQDFDIIYDAVSEVRKNLRMLGFKGATGTQASLKTMTFRHGYNEANAIDTSICYAFDMKPVMISGQTYTRLYDSMVMNALSLLAQAASKMATDIRLMAGFGEISEKFTNGQVGSSAMPYKRNPITCEKVCGLARFIICGSQNTAMTAATQWLERSLDDSSNRRIVIPELFIAADEIMSSIDSIVGTMEVNVAACINHVKAHSAKSSLEDDVIVSTLSGGNRTDLHNAAIYSEGSCRAHVNSGFANEQTKSFCEYIKSKYRSEK